MNRSRLMLLGLCAAVFGVMAFSATAAQAEVNAKWLFAKNEAGTPLVNFLEAGLGVEFDTTLILHSKIAGVSVLFECTGIDGQTITLKANGSIGNGALLEFLNCITKLNGATSAACKPNAGGTKPGVIKTLDFHGLIELHLLTGEVRDDIVKLLPDENGEHLGSVEMGEECSIGEKVPVIGKLTLKDCAGAFLNHLLKHLVEAGPLTELWVISKTAEHVATVLGSVWTKLIGAHAGLLFSGDPA